jgi:GTPase SAR1 family protein
VLLIYSIDQSSSLENLEGWFRDVQDNAHSEAVIWLVGTKLDLE